jgi:hypothetical protein
MLRQAFNALTNLHGRAAQLRRPGDPDLYSPCRITPSNYFRFKAGPEFTDIHGREFIIPMDSIKGSFAQTLTFVATPTQGTLRLNYNGNQTTPLAFNASAATIQTALRLLAGLEQVVVSGTIATALSATFQGFTAEPILILPADHASLLDVDGDPVAITVAQSFASWSLPILRPGDQINDTAFYGNISIKEIIEMPDLGGSIMGLRIRCE